MSFEEWWDKEGRQVSRMIGPLTAEDFAKACYRAGLLHAAEEDENQFKKTTLGVLLESATMHRQAASEVK